MVSDAQEVERCARRALAAPLLSPGVAVHPLASPAAALRDATNEDKAFLDWCHSLR